MTMVVAELGVPVTGIMVGTAVVGAATASTEN